MGGRGRAPCCQKAGLNKGSWTPEEDARLIAHIRQYGHGNWRALPKRAGLLRCGKSCRLRWINYLRPDVKRGNFTKEEEETIINLHELLGNKWAKIASHLPGRTDNEIKNVWNTHLKKRLKLESPVIQSPAQEDSTNSSDGKQSSDNTGTQMEPLFDYLWGMLDEASILTSNEDDALEETRQWLADLEELGLDINDSIWRS